ncbi:MAG: tRNA dihydrouridine(20/20a) synthase DusA [Gammaproteobacteria bacterium HGW-Gammaproteobacteria-7]|nr:MAG: tRNA dihydrouridine(20/20a) synthase DusA [Gammaproteobacteria bacterium HGW-Gammaproteobacteria-7]
MPMIQTQPPAARRLSVAPMMEWTDRHCRYFHRQLAPHAGLYTEMVHAQAVIFGDRGRLLGFDPAEHPVAIQLGGSDPTDLARAAAIAEQWGYDEVNLNCGCPSNRVQAGRFGACLMIEPALVAECVAAMSAAVSVPVTVKCRLGVDDQDDFSHFMAFIDTVAEAGCRHFIVHARNAWLKGLSPKENREVPPLRHDWAYRLKAERPQLNIVLNGGIDTVEAAQRHLDHVDGVMLGRAAYHDPYLLHRLDRALFDPGAGLQSRQALLADMQPYVLARLAEGTALKHLTRHVLGLFHGQYGGRRFRQLLSESDDSGPEGWARVERALAATVRICDSIADAA